MATSTPTWSWLGLAAQRDLSRNCYSRRSIPDRDHNPHCCNHGNRRTPTRRRSCRSCCFGSCPLFMIFYYTPRGKTKRTHNISFASAVSKEYHNWTQAMNITQWTSWNNDRKTDGCARCSRISFIHMVFHNYNGCRHWVYHNKGTVTKTLFVVQHVRVLVVRVRVVRVLEVVVVAVLETVAVVVVTVEVVGGGIRRSDIVPIYLKKVADERRRPLNWRKAAI